MGIWRLEWLIGETILRVALNRFVSSLERLGCSKKGIFGIDFLGGLLSRNC